MTSKSFGPAYPSSTTLFANPEDLALASIDPPQYALSSSLPKHHAPAPLFTRPLSNPASRAQT
ncbi:hypothetical protein N7475_005724 [Penicillium sp. IBT 31633x]|nr:hypothetical protein N7475_005724 [Penicillium sp. IBT 31633x]